MATLTGVQEHAAFLDRVAVLDADFLVCCQR
jgi:hypothetical protein